MSVTTDLLAILTSTCGEREVPTENYLLGYLMYGIFFNSLVMWLSITFHHGCVIAYAIAYTVA